MAKALRINNVPASRLMVRGSPLNQNAKRTPIGACSPSETTISDIGAFRTGEWKLEWFLEAVRRVVVWTIENKATFDFLAHPSCLGVVDPEMKTIDLICQLVRDAGESAEIVDLDQIAADVK